MNVAEFYEFLCKKIPSELTLDGDADGMSCCPDRAREVKKVLVALDATSDVIDEAIEEECEVILTHHPMLFGGVDSVVDGNYRGDKLIKLIKNGIAVMSFHTRLDAVDGGVNDIFAKLLELENVEKYGEKGIGRIGELKEPMTADEFAGYVKNALGAPVVEYSDCGKIIQKVAVIGGSGSSEIGYAIKCGADAVVGGEFKYHDLEDSKDYGISLFAAGHFFTENPVCARLFELAAEAGAMPIITFCNRVKYSV